MRILLTGATGFIGSHLAHRLKTRHEVFVLARRPAADKLPEVRWIEQDMTAPLDYNRLPRPLDAIIHLAQSKFYKQFPEKAADIFEVNTQSTLRLLEYGRKVGVSRFIYSSSGGIYGVRDEGFMETDPVNPSNFYLGSKYCAEVLIANYRQFFDTIIHRLFFVYGAEQSPTMLIPRLVNAVATGVPIELQGDDGIRINPVYISDAVDAIERSLALDGSHLINLGGPQVLSLRQIGEIIGKKLGREPVFKVHADQKPEYIIGDVTKMRALLGGPVVPFSDGVMEVCREFEREQIVRPQE
jgi:UDP-glucose 4-epimerase